MKSVFAWIAFLVLLAGLPGSATESVSFDGVWWQSLDRSDKLTAVEGMLVGITAGYSDVVSRALMVYPYSKANMAAHQKLLDAWPDPSLTFGTVANKIDAVYRDHPEDMKRPVSTFAICASTAGTDCSEEAK